MAGPPFAFAQHFQVVGNFHGLSPNDKWRTELTVNQSTGVPQPTDAIIIAIRDYFLHNVRNDCTLDTITLRQWSFGPQPLLARGALWEESIAQLGLKSSTYGGEADSSHVAGNEVVAFVKLLCGAAKPGKQFIRQLLDLDDIAAQPGEPWVFRGGSRVTPAVYHTSTNATLHTYWGAADPGLVVVHFSAKHYNANPVTANLPFSTTVQDMQLIKVATNKPTRKNKK
jgi:hypothetical protein